MRRKIRTKSLDSLYLVVYNTYALIAPVSEVPMPNSEKAAEFREAAAAARKSAEESWERSDTDGFLSQWASGLTASLNDAKAKIAEADGKSEFPGLFTPDGRRVRAKLIDGKYGRCWAVMDANWKFVKFVAKAPRVSPETPDCIPRDVDDAWMAAYAEGRNRELKAYAKWAKKHGFEEEPEMAPADAKFEGRGRGLSGSCWVVVYRTDKGCPADAVVVV